MMEQLLTLAMRVSDQAEVYCLDSRSDGISFENAQLKDIDSSIHSGISLRIMKDNTLGFAYTRNLLHREDLIQNATDSLKGGVGGSFQLPMTRALPTLDTYNDSIEKLTNAAIVEECQRVCEILSERSKGQINVSAYRSIGSRRIINNSGTDLSLQSSAYIFNAQILYPYTSASMHRSIIAKAFKKTPDDYLDYLVTLYNRSLQEVSVDSKQLKVLFLPETVYVLMWRLQSATNGLSIYQKISPVAEKIGKNLFDARFSVYNNPLDDAIPGARIFDDEGTPCTLFPVVEKGVLKNFYYDLYFAQKLNAVPTGHGFKGSITSKPVPSLAHLTIPPDNTSFDDLLRTIDCGIIVAGALGAHSGNIPHGDFSIGVSPALYVEKGEIAGHVKDVMVAGNIYDTLSEILEIEDTVHPVYGGNFPSLLFDNMHVTIKK